MRRLGRFKDKKVAAEGEQWVKREWERMEKPEPRTDQQQSAKVAPSGLKRGLDDVDGNEDRACVKRVKSSYAFPSVGSPVYQNGSEKLVIDLTQDGDEDPSGKQVEAPYFEPGVAPVSQAEGKTTKEAVVEGMPGPVRGLKRTFDDRAMEVPREAKRLKGEGHEQE